MKGEDNLLKDNESGISLVELLATLALVSIVISLIWTAFSVSTKFNLIETQKLKLQQEANYIVAEVQRLHRICDSYTFILSAEQITIDNCEIRDEHNNLLKKNFILSNNYEYSYKKWIENEQGEEILKEMDVVNHPFTDIIKPKSENLLIDELILKNPTKKTVSVSLPISISRYKDTIK